MTTRVICMLFNIWNVSCGVNGYQFLNHLFIIETFCSPERLGKQLLIKAIFDILSQNLEYGYQGTSKIVKAWSFFSFFSILLFD